jgi:hypothetical protein
MGRRKAEVCGVRLVRECGWGCSLGAEVASWSAYVQVDAGERASDGVWEAAVISAVSMTLGACRKST